MKVKQHPYLSPEARALRERDNVPPWSIHPCEVDHFGPIDKILPLTFRAEVARVAAMRRALENDE